MTNYGFGTLESGMASSSDETSLAETGAARKISSSSGAKTGWLSPGGSQEGGHLPHGTLLAERYRVISLLGRGGMGEVYRADDLRLGQPVAVKFLPEAVNDDPVRLAQFHNEVRIARQVSHRNVCRVYDIGESDGRTFLTMEYVDGEDLATLLKRIGRLPQDKGVEVARQICAGLAAAHEQGVLHRDLKPANIMLDGEGRVRITDFGLAGVAEEIEDIRSGTPAYMAPEQLGGREVSTRSDLFALGLVLYEIFTGRRAFDAKNVAELLRMHDEGVHLTPTSAVRDLDPAIERVIQRCLEPDAAKRPGSAIAVSAALPGGDPLAAALAAGETPSLEMVAAAGAIEAVPLRIGLSLLAFVLIALPLLVVLSGGRSYTEFVPFEKPPEALADRAVTVRRTLGYREPPADQFGGLSYQSDTVVWARGNKVPGERWKTLPTGRLPTITYWNRTSPRPIVPHVASNWPTASTDPPLVVTGMTLTVLDTLGRLIEFNAVPPQRDAPANASAAALVSAGADDAASAPAPAPPDWAPLFALAELPADRFQPATPEWAPRNYADTRAAWVGTIPELGETPLRLEAAAYRGRITFFQVIGPWTRPGRMNAAPVNPQQRVFTVLQVTIVMSGLLAAALLARRNLALGKGDRAGGRRVAWAVFVLALAGWVLEARHFADFPIEQNRFFQAVAECLFSAMLFWVIYMAVEPWIRRHWPDCLIGWSRLLSRGARDPLVGRDSLVGVAAGMLVFAAHHGSLWMEGLRNGVVDPAFGQYNGLESLRYILSDAVETAASSPINAVFFAFAYVGLRRVLRWRPAAAVGLVLVFSVFTNIDGVSSGIAPFLIGALLALIITTVLLRFGLLAFMAAMFINNLLHRAPWTPDVSAWYATSMLVVITLTAALAIVAFVQSRAGAPLFGGLLEE
jgi:predicted Ser/Thr protein kinase